MCSARLAPGRYKGVRTLCFVLSLAAHNAWVMACAEAQAGSADGWLPPAMFQLALVMAAADLMGPEPEPPAGWLPCRLGLFIHA